MRKTRNHRVGTSQSGVQREAEVVFVNRTADSLLEHFGILRYDTEIGRRSNRIVVGFKLCRLRSQRLIRHQIGIA